MEETVTGWPFSGKPGNLGKVREFDQSRKSLGIFIKVGELFGKIREFLSKSGNF